MGCQLLQHSWVSPVQIREQITLWHLTPTPHKSSTFKQGFPQNGIMFPAISSTCKNFFLVARAVVRTDVERGGMPPELLKGKETLVVKRV